MQFGSKVKLSPHYIGPYQILNIIGKVAYELELPIELASAHSVFHVSILRKCVGDPSLINPIKSVGIKYSLSYDEVLIEMLDHQVCNLRIKEVV